MDITKSKGNIVELQCMSAFMELGYNCSIPYGDGAKYDFIVDYNGELLRIQCKSSTHPIRNGIKDTEAFHFSTVSQTTNTTKTTRHTYSSEQIDYFATWFNGNVYVVPVEECSTNKTLRFSPPNNGNNNYNKAEDYLISKRFISLYPIEEESLTKEFKCIECNTNKVSSEGGICYACNSFKKRTVERPSREELKMLIRTESFVKIGQRYKVSDNAIRKWCKAERLPTKKSEIKSISESDWEKI